MRKRVVFQERNAALLNTLKDGGSLLPVRQGAVNFVHTVSPFACEIGAENDHVQSLTFETMHRAKIAYTALDPAARVQHVAACFQEDAEYARMYFDEVAVISASSLDFNFRQPRKLPLLFDILSAAVSRAQDADYIVFTNVDICLTVGFYDSLSALIGLGYDALVINRRTIEKFPPAPTVASLACASLGAYHPGFDCFVFKAELFDKFIRTDAIIGMGGVMQSLLMNMLAFAEKMIVLKDVHLTYHLGDDRTWARQENAEYIHHNGLQERKLFAACGPAERERLIQQGFSGMA